MKKIILITACIILGVRIYGMILTDDDSLRKNSADVMKKQVEQYKMTP